MVYNSEYICPMSIRTPTKINRLISAWPKGQIYTQKHLHHLGYNSTLVHRYIRSGWIEIVGVGAYKKVNDNASWEAGLSAIQDQLSKKIHAGGKTGLALLGFSHYGVVNESEVFLYTPENETLPAWFKNYPWSVKIHFTRSTFQHSLDPNSYVEVQQGEFHIRVSSPERAVLELLYHIPGKQGFDEAFKLMELLQGIRPTLMQTLLEGSHSVKVNRLFFFMAEKINQPWVRRLNPDRVLLGSGKRVVVKNGRLNKRYEITVPVEYAD